LPSLSVVMMVTPVAKWEIASRYRFVSTALCYLTCRRHAASAVRCCASLAGADCR
jgi:hypothetical protein